MHCRRYTASGFTLIELSIVIAVIGLIAGAVTIGRDMLQASKLQAVIADLQRFSAAVTSFRDKYSALPGDMPNATGIWGIAAGSGTDSACQSQPRVDTLTCNGDGNGAIDPPGAFPVDETTHAWQQLKNADFLSGPFVGTNVSVPDAQLLGNVLPPTKINGIGYQFVTQAKSAEGWTNSPEGDNRILAIRVAGMIPGSAPELGPGSRYKFSAFSIRSIDEKMDDLKPGSGKIYGYYTGSLNCFTGNDALRAAYTTNEQADESNGCFFQYNLSR